MDTMIRPVQRVHGLVWTDLKKLYRRSPRLSNDRSSVVASLDQIRDGMEDVGTRVAELIQWTKVMLARVGGHNRLGLEG